MKMDNRIERAFRRASGNPYRFLNALEAEGLTLIDTRRTLTFSMSALYDRISLEQVGRDYVCRNDFMRRFGYEMMHKLAEEGKFSIKETREDDMTQRFSAKVTVTAHDLEDK